MATEKPSPPFGTKKFNRQLQRPAGESPLVGGRPTPLKNLKVSWEGLSHILWENKTCSKPPSSIYIIYIYIYRSNQLSSDRIEAMVFAQLLPRALKAGAGQQHLELEGWGKTSSTCWTCWHLLGGQAVYY